MKTNSPRFTHLHLHSVYSLLDGAIRIPDLMKYVKQQGMDSVAITDHGNMFGAVDFYESAKKEGIKPIIGCEVYVAAGSRKEKRQVNKIADGGNYHLVLLAKNKKGYKNLIKLSSIAYKEGFYKKPRIDYEILSEYSEGLVGLTACLGGEVNRKLVEGENQKAENLAGKLNEILGKNNFFLEIQDHGIPEQKIVSKGAVEISKKLGIPLVLTNDSHFLRKEDQKAQDIMLRIQMNKKIDEEMAFSFNSNFYVKSPKEMQAIYPELPEAFHNASVISDMVNLDMEFGHPLLPDFQTPDNMTLSDYLYKLSQEGLQKKFNGNSIPKHYIDRLNSELKTINAMGFAGYFLIVADFIRFAKEQSIPVGPGRGSAAGSLVAMSLGITDIDPIQYNLLFERFLNPSRKEMPDIDIDFCRDKREVVYDYVIKKYGEDHVSQIITFGTLSAKAVVKDVARVLGFSFSDINMITKNFPDTLGSSLEDVLSESELVRSFFQKGEKEKLLIDVAKVLEGIPRNAGKHAAGVVIGPQALDEIIPLAFDTKSRSIITQFEKEALEKSGLVKIDFLGLKNLTVIQKCLEEIKKRHSINVDIHSIPIDDAKTYKMLQEGKTKGVFQLENAGITKMLKRAKPTSFDDIVACIALYRPGPLQSGMTEEYIQCKIGNKSIDVIHEDITPILKETLGTIVYQEQVMIISQIISDFSMSKADDLRKAMGKKKYDIVAKLKKDFIEGGLKNGHKREFLENLYDKLSDFVSYCFNKSHSVSYGMITYQTAYLKANYPVEF